MTIYKGDMYFKQEDFPFFIDRYTIRKSEYIPSHTHDFIELVFVVEGSAGTICPVMLTGLPPETYSCLSPTYTTATAVPRTRIPSSTTCCSRPPSCEREMDVLQQMPSFVNFFYLVPFLRKSHSFVPYHPLQPAQKLQMQPIWRRSTRNSRACVTGISS